MNELGVLLMSIEYQKPSPVKWSNFFLADRTANVARQDKQKNFYFENKVSENEVSYTYTEAKINGLNAIDTEGDQI